MRQCYRSRSFIAFPERPGDVEQRRHESSLADRTISGVIGGLSRSTTNPGIGRSVSTARGRPPRRASSDSAAPRETPRSCANARAVARTSSSTFSVVRIGSSLYRGIRGQNDTVAVIEMVRGAPSHVAFSVMADRYALSNRLFATMENSVDRSSSLNASPEKLTYASTSQ